MNFIKSKIIFLFFGALFAGFVISACNSNPPVIAAKTVAGTLPTFTSTPCWTMGISSVGSTLDAVDVAWAYSYPVVPNVNKTLTHMVAYSSSNIPVTYEMGIYSDNGAGAPNFLLGETAPQTSGPVTGWNKAPVSFTVSLSSGVTYWLVLHSTNLYYQGIAGLVYAYKNIGTTFGALPTSFAGATSTGVVFSFYGTACP